MSFALAQDPERPAPNPRTPAPTTDILRLSTRPINADCFRVLAAVFHPGPARALLEFRRRPVQHFPVARFHSVRSGSTTQTVRLTYTLGQPHVAHAPRPLDAHQLLVESRLGHAASVSTGRTNPPGQDQHRAGASDESSGGAERRRCEAP